MLSIEERFLVIVIALVVDAVIGERLWQRIPHPAAMMGGVVALLDRAMNRDDTEPGARRAAGIVAITGLTVGALVLGWVLEAVLGFLPLTIFFEAFVVAVLVAGRSLFDHVAAVATGMDRDGLEGGRDAVSHIVGRDPASLDAPAVARAAIESAGENFSDGVVAPVFWYAVLGLPGIIALKAINTADSMIGHRSERYRDFGMGTARLDDIVNWVPARLSAGLIAVGALAAKENGAKAVQAALEDAPRHRSVNAGWPEAAMAGALGLALAGPRSYDGVRVDDAWMNRGARCDANTGDIRRALMVMVWASITHAGLYAVLAILS